MAYWRKPAAEPYDPLGLYKKESPFRRKQPIQRPAVDVEARKAEQLIRQYIGAVASDVLLRSAFNNQNIEAELAATMKDETVSAQLDGKKWAELRATVYRRARNTDPSAIRQPGESLN